MSKIQLYIPKKDIKFFQTLTFTSLSENHKAHGNTNKCDKEITMEANPTNQNEKEKEEEEEEEDPNPTSMELHTEKEKETEEEKGKIGISREEEEENDGYHTPTSPSSKIPPPLICPGAPKISSIEKFIKKKDRIVKRQLEVSDEEIVSSFQAESGSSSKKARKEDK